MSLNATKEGAVGSSTSTLVFSLYYLLMGKKATSPIKEKAAADANM
jgi:hypothetical protein